MQVNHEFDINIHRIKSYAKGEVTIVMPILADLSEPGTDSAHTPRGLKQSQLTSSIIIMPERLVRDWPPQSLPELRQEDIQHLAGLEPEIVILGTGEHLQWPDRSLLAPLMEAGIGYEIMDTAAACRTYNILSFEGRNVAAALMMI